MDMGRGIPDMREFSIDNRDNWLWTMMIMQPEIVTQELFAQALAQAKQKKPSPVLAKIRLERYSEGLSAQIMYIGLKRVYLYLYNGR